MQIRESITNEQAIRAALNAAHKSKTNRFDLSRKQLRSFYREFKQSLLVMDETPKSWSILTKNYGYFMISKEYSIKCGMFLVYIDTWYLRNILAQTTGAGGHKKTTKSVLELLSSTPTR